MTNIEMAILIALLLNLTLTAVIKFTHKLLHFFDDRVVIGVLANEFYFTPSIHYSFYSHSLYLQFFILDVTVYFGKPTQTNQKELSPKTQKALDEFFKQLEKEGDEDDE